jgi:5'-nucleotidase
MRFLLTNDDGIEADGLAVLRAAVDTFGQATVVAPHVGQSGCSHSVTYRDDIRVTRLQEERLGVAYSCEGTPADCVRLALSSMDLGKFDWVLAGVNQGGNVGVDVFYSGTVAAVREAAIMGCRGVALSQYLRSDVPLDWQRVTERVRHLLGQFLEAAEPSPPVWNVNLPLAGGPPPKVQVTTLSRDPLPMEYERVDPDGKGGVSYRYSGSYPDRVAAPGTDVAAVFAGDISVTPLGLEGVHPAALRHSFVPPEV